MSSSSDDNSPVDPSDNAARPCTPDADPNPLGKDPNSTPARASATATAHAFDRPVKKDLRPVYTGLERMEYNLKQVTLESFLEDYLPGTNIPKNHLKSLHYVADLSKQTHEWKINTAICRLANSVTSCKKTPKGQKSKNKTKNSDDCPIVTLDISNWSPKAPVKRAETAEDLDGAKDSGDADDADDAEDPDDADDAEDPNDDDGNADDADDTGNADAASSDPNDVEATSDPDDDLKTATRVDVGVFFKNDRFKDVVSIPPAEFMKTSRMKSKANKEVRKNHVGRCSWADVVVPIEVKINTQKSAFYFEDDPTKFLRTDSNDGREALGQLGEYIGQVFGHQHRVHLYAVYVYKDRARLLYFERQGALVSEPFKYGTRKDLTLHTFFWRLANMSRDQLGFDPTVVPADADAVKEMLEYAPRAPTDYIEKQIYRALSVDPTDPTISTSSQWPPYELKMCGRQYIIARPMSASPALYGRCTRGFLAYDITGKAVRFLKDVWRLDLERVQPEHKVYERLHSKDVGYIATCLAHEDVPSSNGDWQRTTVHSLLSPPRPARGHYRLLIEEVCRPLTDFKDFAELTALMCFAIIAHREAWEDAGVLHRDISVSNILIFEPGRGKVIRTAILSDWDLCKFKEEMCVDLKARTPDRTGTWYFRSALSVRFPWRPYMLADDIESFVHVYHYCVLRFHETNRTAELAGYVESVYDVVTVRKADGAHIGSVTKLDQMRSSTPQIEPTTNKTLMALLTEIAQLCSEHYATIDLKQLATEYGDPKLSGEEEEPNSVPEQASILLSRRKHSKRPRHESPEPMTPSPADTQPTVASGDHGAVHPTVMLDGQSKPQPKLNDHEALHALFMRYATGNPDENGRSVRWLGTSTKCEDLFKGTSVAPRKDNNFSSSYRSRGCSQDQDEPPTKKRRRGDGTSLPGVEESQEE